MKYLARAAFVCALLAAFAADYPWGDWVGHTHWSRVGWIPFYSWPVRALDIAENLLLFFPAGILSPCVFRRHPVRWVAVLTLMVGFVGEWTQLYSHTRFPSATDLTCNILGAALAAVLSRRLLHARN